MLFLARYFMEGPKQAYLGAAALAVLTLLFSPVGFLLGAGIALVTLQVGIRQGAQVLAAGAATLLVLSQLVLGAPWTGLVGLLEFALPAWLFAAVLRQTGSLASAILMVVWLVGVAVIGFHLAVGDTVAWWQDVLKRVFQPAMEQAQVSLDAATWKQLAELATTMLAMSMTILWIGMVLFARWWQAALYDEGRFRQEFHNLMLPRQFIWLTGLVALAGLIIGPGQHGLISELFGVLSAGLMFQGLAVIHALVDRRQMSSNWLFATYVLLMLFPQMILLLALLALIDLWLDLRQRYATPNNED